MQLCSTSHAASLQQCAQQHRRCPAFPTGAIAPRRVTHAAPKQGSFVVRRQQQVGLGAAAAVASTAAAVAGPGQAAFPALQAAITPWLPYAMAASAACCLVLIAMMLIAPGAEITQRSARSNTPVIAIAVLYGIVLLASWSTDTMHLMMPGSLAEGFKGGFNPQFFPTLGSIQALFSRPFTAASFLLHVAAINLIAARSAFLDGLTSRVPTFHSVVLSAVVGPLGLLSHQLTKAIYSILQATTGRDLRPAAQPIRIRAQSPTGQGTITIMPYDK
eukprot:GHUV01003745.1.p1 GENE.GHUV01003745.1~~GHUV01003745.1.p1  ORF type:complete len:274 (+),score=56.20 GHUV01003745.1:251-1072(+)